MAKTIESRAKHHSTIWRVGLAMTVIVALVAIGVLSSIRTTRITQDTAEAIKQAGHLRTQSYRITTALTYNKFTDPENYWLLIDDQADLLEEYLHGPHLVGVLSTHSGGKLRPVYDHLVSQWENKVKTLPSFCSEPPADDEMASLHNAMREAVCGNPQQPYLSAVDNFVADIDYFVAVLEEGTQAEIERQGMIQLIILILTLGCALVTMYLLRSRILTPLKTLLSCAQGVRRGDFSLHAPDDENDELGRLGSAFNVMARDLSKMHADWEERVAEKTADLERSNRSLELLYHTIKRLSEAPLSNNTFYSLLTDIEQPLGLGAGTICLAESDSDRPFILAFSRPAIKGVPDICIPGGCRGCFKNRTTREMEIPFGSKQRVRMLSTPIKDQEHQYGVLLMEIPPDTRLEEWQTRLLEAVARHIGMALNITQRVTETRRLALLEERSVIARELHDSLAQSLSYLKIQATRLDFTLSDRNSKEDPKSIVEELRQGISNAYRQLRELLTTFRLKIEGTGLASAIEGTVKEIQERSGIEISLDNRLGGCQLNAHEEIHILQVVREALTNVTNHSKADRARVDLRHDHETGRITICIDDDGIGISEHPERLNHYGLAIINERAERLGGKVQLSRRREGGTRVRLAFLPATYGSDQKPPKRGIQ